MDDAALGHFLRLSETLHFGRASRDRHLSPSALSRVVKRLEDEVGWPLFERDKRTVRLTAQGRELAVYARRALGEWDDLRRRLRRPDDALSGQISVFASVTACQSFLPRVLAAFRARHPEVHIQLETGYAADALEMARTGAVDVAVAALPERVPPALAARVVLHTPLVFVAPAADCDAARLVRKQPVPWADVPIVLPAAGQARRDADRWFRRQRLAPRLYGEVPGSEAILSLVALGCGVGIVPAIVFDKSPLRRELRRLPTNPPIGVFRVGVATPTRRLQSPLVRAFFDSLA
jgi:LysR family positive regulator for ilvC